MNKQEKTQLIGLALTTAALASNSKEVRGIFAFVGLSALLFPKQTIKATDAAIKIYQDIKKKRENTQKP